MDASMSWSLFLRCIKEIQSLSEDLQDGWVLHGSVVIENEAFLSKKVYKPVAIMLGGITNPDGETIITIEYHVVFSCTYSCPVLCFNAWKNNGTQVSLEEWWKYLDVSASEEKYSMLTQLDHPVLKKPYLMLHPCKTSEFINKAFASSKNKVMSWLSIMGPVVGLLVLPEYAKLTF